jgi:hypothetical protein
MRSETIHNSRQTNKQTTTNRWIELKNKMKEKEKNESY